MKSIRKTRKAAPLSRAGGLQNDIPSRPEGLRFSGILFMRSMMPVVRDVIDVG